MLSRRFRAWLKVISQKIAGGMGLGVRIAFCFAVGFVVLIATQSTNFDNRFTLRGPQHVSSDIVLVRLSREDLAWMSRVEGFHRRANVMWSLKEIVETSDSFFWHPRIWDQTIRNLESARAKAIVVTLFFGEETTKDSLTAEESQLFRRGNIFWSAKHDADGRPVLPGLAAGDAHNSGTFELRADPDGKIRHFLAVSYNIPNVGIRISNFVQEAKPRLSAFSHTGQLINFLGPEGTFRAVSFDDVAKGRISSEVFRDKIVIIDLKDVPSHLVQTPVGQMSNGELLANVIENFVHHRWISQIPLWLDTLYLIIVVLISLWIIFEYPQIVAFVFLGFLAIAVMAVSTALFDLQNIWLPVASPLAALLACYVVLSSYRLSESEKTSWESERELHYLSEVESLKNNFLSLISHDLKTPIAKIQGVTDRLLAVKDIYLPEDVKLGLNTIKSTSEELRQYIGSILQLTRVEARNIKLTKEVCDINTIVADVVQKVWPLAEQKHIQIRQNLEPLWSVEVDRSLITEVLLNLVENAVKYTDFGGTIEVTTQETSNQVKVIVTDTGGGIPEEELPKVFEKFYRGSGDKTFKVTGTGLGLYLVKYFIELHGGKVFITSQVGVGTTIGFTLPLEESEDHYADFTQSHR